MMEPRYTEAGWHAYDRLTKHPISIDHTINEVGPRKRIYGGLFGTGEFCTSRFTDRRAYPQELQGPRLPICFVFEQQSEIIISCATTLQGALSVAREALQLTQSSLLQRLVSEGKAALIQQRVKAQAMQEAGRAIAHAQAPQRKTISKRARAVFEASEGKCHYCGVALTLDGKWHIEHKFPRALFGGSEQSNLVASCAPCNHAKKDKTDLEFKAAREAAGVVHAANSLASH